MNTGLLVIVTVAVLLVVLLVGSRIRRLVASRRAHVERRSGADRRQVNLPVPIERRRRIRRSDDVDRELASAVS